MYIVALIGKSGTGKSYRAQLVARENNIEYIIDDGILIGKNTVFAGISAKMENTRIAATKRAVFTDKNHRINMISTINSLNVQAILILGTSENMINKIVKNLDLHRVDKWICIEDIATKKEIEFASKVRKEKGMHVIPVPTFAIKKNFSGYFIETLKSFKKKEKEHDEDLESTVVRPNFSYLGKYTISDSTMKSIIEHICNNIEGVYKIHKVNILNRSNNIIINIDISINYGYIINSLVTELKQQLKKEIEYITAFNIIEINVYLKSLNIKT